jgi:redox-sensitive bicupin YhaK (pirin superfamily)
VNVYVSEPQAGFVQSYNLRAGRQIYFICIEGGIKVNGTLLAARDAARITSAASVGLELEAGQEGAHM